MSTLDIIVYSWAIVTAWLVLGHFCYWVVLSFDGRYYPSRGRRRVLRTLCYAGAPAVSVILLAVGLGGGGISVCGHIRSLYRLVKDFYSAEKLV